MPTEKQTNFIKHLLSKRGYYCDDWGWLGSYSIKAAGKLIDKLLKPAQWSEWIADFMAQLPPPKEKKRRQAFLPLPDPEPKPVSETPDERTRFKRWGREVYARGELTITQLGELYDAKFGNPFKVPILPVGLPIKLP